VVAVVAVLNLYVFAVAAVAVVVVVHNGYAVMEVIIPMLRWAVTLLIRMLALIIQMTFAQVMITPVM